MTPPLTIANLSNISPDFGFSKVIITYIAIIWRCFRRNYQVLYLLMYLSVLILLIPKNLFETVFAQGIVTILLSCRKRPEITFYALDISPVLM